MTDMESAKAEALALRDREELEGTLLPVATAYPVSEPNVPVATATPIDITRDHPGTTAVQLAPFVEQKEITTNYPYPDQDRYKRGDDMHQAALATHTGRMNAYQEREVVRQENVRKKASYNAQQEQGVTLANFAAHQENRWEKCNRTVPIATPPVVADAMEDKKKDDVESSGYAFGTGNGGYEVREYDVKEYNTGTYEVSEYKSVYD